MRFHRTAKIFRGRVDAAPLAGIFFLLLIFLLMASLVYTPGVSVTISPTALTPPPIETYSSTAGPTMVVTVNVAGNFFFENQLINSEQLQSRLAASAMRARSPLTLIVLADKNVAYGVIMRLTQLAEKAGITNILLQGQPIPAKTMP